jgi:hypothetical protein
LASTAAAAAPTSGSGDQRGLAVGERQADSIVVANGLGALHQEHAIEESGRTQVHHRQAGPAQHLLCEPVLLLLRAACGLCLAHLGHRHL